MSSWSDSEDDHRSKGSIWPRRTSHHQHHSSSSGGIKIAAPKRWLRRVGSLTNTLRTSSSSSSLRSTSTATSSAADMVTSVSLPTNPPPPRPPRASATLSLDDSSASPQWVSASDRRILSTPAIVRPPLGHRNTQSASRLQTIASPPSLSLHIDSPPTKQLLRHSITCSPIEGSPTTIYQRSSQAPLHRRPLNVRMDHRSPLTPSEPTEVSTDEEMFMLTGGMFNDGGHGSIEGFGVSPAIASASSHLLSGRLSSVEDWHPPPYPTPASMAKRRRWDGGLRSGEQPSPSINIVHKSFTTAGRGPTHSRHKGIDLTNLPLEHSPLPPHSQTNLAAPKCEKKDSTLTPDHRTGENAPIGPVMPFWNSINHETWSRNHSPLSEFSDDEETKDNRDDWMSRSRSVDLAVVGKDIKQLLRACNAVLRS